LILSVLDSGKREDAVRMIEDVCGSFDAPGSGILFTVKVAHVRGLAREIL
jgi:hypothetical protein